MKILNFLSAFWNFNFKPQVIEIPKYSKMDMLVRSMYLYTWIYFMKTQEQVKNGEYLLLRFVLDFHHLDKHGTELLKLEIALQNKRIEMARADIHLFI